MRTLLLILVAVAGMMGAIQASASVKWHPGHYYTILGDKNNATYLKTVYSELKNTPALRGVLIRYSWAELETSYGVYDFTSIDKRLAELAAQNKRLVILLQMKSFDSKIFPIPGYLKAAEYDGGAFAFSSSISASVGGYNIKMWNPNVLSRMVKLFEALGKRYNSHPYFEGIGLTETAMGASVIPITTAQTDSFYNNMLTVNKRMRGFFPNTMTFQFTNYPRPILDSFIGSLSAMGAGLGGPDIFIEENGLLYTEAPKGVYNYYPALSGTIPLSPSVMPANYKNTRSDGTGHEPSVLELLTFARDKLKANYIFWTRDPAYFQKLLNLLNDPAQVIGPSGGLGEACPAAYIACAH